MFLPKCDVKVLCALGVLLVGSAFAARPKTDNPCLHLCPPFDSPIGPGNNCCFRINFSSDHSSPGHSDEPCPLNAISCVPCSERIMCDLDVHNCGTETIGWTFAGGTVSGLGDGHFNLSVRVYASCDSSATATCTATGGTPTCQDDASLTLNCGCAN